MDPWRELGFESEDAFRQEVGGHLQDIVTSYAARQDRLTEEDWRLYRVANKSLTLLRLLSLNAPETIIANHIETLRKSCEEFRADD